MISTPISSTSDYYSGSDFDYDDDEDVVKAAPQHHSSLNETNIILQTLLQHHTHQLLGDHSSTIKLLKLVKENGLSNEVFIRANTILQKFLLATCTNHVDQSILIACLSLSTKLTEHSNHFTKVFFNSDSLILNEDIICNALDWDIDIITPINYIEAILLHVMDYSLRDQIRKLSYELIVLCLNDADCMNISVVSLGMGCLLIACELLKCCELIPKHMFEFEQNKDILFEISLMNIRQALMNNFHQ